MNLKKRIEKTRRQLLRDDIYRRDDYRCRYCGRQFTRDQLTLDHVKPKARRGPSTRDNLVACCTACNKEKRDMSARDFMAIREQAMSDEYYTRLVTCHDCGRAYGGPGWIEAVLPHDLWAKVSPTGGAAGILCINCIATRCDRLGMEDVPVKLTAGPLVAAANAKLLEACRAGDAAIELYYEFRRCVIERLKRHPENPEWNYWNGKCESIDSEIRKSQNNLRAALAACNEQEAHDGQ
jgi:hypothetical protein